MAWLDISVPIKPGMVTFPGDPTVHIELASALARGDVCNVSRLDLGAHSGTHVDAPVHFIDGAAGAESLDLDALIGPAVVVDGGAADSHLDAAAVDALGIPAGAERVLVKTRSSRLWDLPDFSSEFIGLAEAGAARMVELGVRLVGIDYLSIAPFGDPTPTHRVLLGAGVIVLEGLDLRTVEPGAYDLVCLPLRIVGGDGAPARALLRPRS